MRLARGAGSCCVDYENHHRARSPTQFTAEATAVRMLLRLGGLVRVDACTTGTEVACWQVQHLATVLITIRSSLLGPCRPAG